LQKKLVIQGKQIAMHYSNPRPKFEDWLCSKVECLFLSEGVCLSSSPAQWFEHSGTIQTQPYCWSV